MIDMARWMLGAPESVSAQLNTIVDRSAIAGHEAGSANDTARLLLHFADCPDVLVEASVATPMGDRFVQQIVRIEGTEASVEIDHVFGGAEAGARIRISRGGEAFTPVAVPEAFTAGADPADLFSLYRKGTVGARLFTHCIASGHREGPSFADGVAVQQVIDAAFRSDREGQRITL